MAFAQVFNKLGEVPDRLQGRAECLPQGILGVTASLHPALPCPTGKDSQEAEISQINAKPRLLLSSHFEFNRTELGLSLG